MSACMFTPMMSKSVIINASVTSGTEE